jgi:CubicO group peptidase (beta-lactamase class C family)
MKRLITCLLLLFLILSPSNVPAAGWPGTKWETATPSELGLDASKLSQARDYALTGEGSGCIIYQGKLVMSWGDAAALYDLKSSSKSIGSSILGLAIKDGKVKLDDLAKSHHPGFGILPEENAKTGWIDKITLRMLANQTAGFEKQGGYQPLLFEPNTKWHYSDCGPNWLAECMTHAYQRDLNDIIWERVFTPIGIQKGEIKWRAHAYRPKEFEGVTRREFGSGFSANVQAMARFGYLYLREGWWQGEQILPPSFIQAIRNPDPVLAKLKAYDKSHGEAAAHYSLLWWNNRDGTLDRVPRDAYWTWGLYDSLIVVVPSLDLVIARAGKSWKRVEGGGHYDPLKPFLDPIADAVKAGKSAAVKLPYPFSPVIQGIDWAPTNTIQRAAKGSDNWPLAWAGDDHLYTAYGDGHGFEPRVKEKLSLGLARVEDGPKDFNGFNLHSPTAESKGDGKYGRKASGMLSINGTLYLLVRNVSNAQLAWSMDHGGTWTWADWKFTESFGCPGFVSYGKDYAGARDGFVYLYSQDSDSAYERADRFVMARVPKEKLRERSAYEFFVRLDSTGQPVWSRNVNERGAVFTHAGSCYRSSMSYHAGLKRYLWCQTGAGNDTRFSGGFAIYDAPEPWGPWTVAYHSDTWDVGPGESMHLPPKWFSADGSTIHLVFSGDDRFSVRAGKLLQKQ